MEVWNALRWERLRNAAECRRDGLGQEGQLSCLNLKLWVFLFCEMAQRCLQEQDCSSSCLFLSGSPVASLALLPLKERGCPLWLILPWLSAGSFGRYHLHSLRCRGTIREGTYINRLALGGIRYLFSMWAHLIVRCHQFSGGGQFTSASQPTFPRSKLDSSQLGS